MDDLKSWLPVGASLLALGTAAWNMISSPARAVDARLSKVADQVADHATRLGHVEETLEHLPDRDSLHRMQVSLTELNGRIEVLTERLKPVAAISDRLQDYLIEQARK